MAYTAPTPANLKARYPAFDAVADDTIQYWLTDAERSVDQSWPVADYAPALMALAAHNMTIGGIGATTGSVAIPAGVTRFKSGTIDVTLSDDAAAAQTKGGYAATRYGQEYASLLRRVKGGPRLIAAGRMTGCAVGYRSGILG